MIPRDNIFGDPHASYHKSGTRQVRSHGLKLFIIKLQRPDQSFRGTEALFAMAIPPGDVPLLRILCVPEEFSEVWELNTDQVPPEAHHTLAVDLVEPGFATIPVLGKEIVAQTAFQDACPWILVTLWRGMLF